MAAVRTVIGDVVSEACSDLRPLQPCSIADCGEHKDEDGGAGPSDGTGDAHPDFPEDSDVDFKDVSVAEVFEQMRLFWKMCHFLVFSETRGEDRYRDPRRVNIANAGNVGTLLLNQFNGVSLNEG